MNSNSQTSLNQNQSAAVNTRKRIPFQDLEQAMSHLSTKRIICAVAVAISSLTTLSIADGTGAIGFVPSGCAVGLQGPYSNTLAAYPASYYWAIKDGNSYYNLGRQEDAAAKSRYVTCLSAQVQGKSVLIGIWALNWAQISTAGRHDELPETFIIQ